MMRQAIETLSSKPLSAHLRAPDLGSGGVLHQVVDGDAAVAAQPGLQVHDAHVHVHPQASLRARTLCQPALLLLQDVLLLDKSD